MDKQLQDKLFELLESPDDWTLGDHTIKHESGLELWIANAPYGDLSLWRPFETERVKGYFNRRRMRQTIEAIAQHAEKKRIADLLASLEADKEA